MVSNTALSRNILDNADAALIGGPTAKCVLIALQRHMGRNKSCWPSARRLARMTGFSRRTIYRALNRLRSAEVIHVQPRYVVRPGHVGNYRQTSNLYRICTDKLAALSEAAGGPLRRFRKRAASDIGNLRRDEQRQRERFTEEDRRKYGQDMALRRFQREDEEARREVLKIANLVGMDRVLHESQFIIGQQSSEEAAYLKGPGQVELWRMAIERVRQHDREAEQRAP